VLALACCALAPLLGVCGGVVCGVVLCLCVLIVLGMGVIVGDGSPLITD